MKPLLLALLLALAGCASTGPLQSFRPAEAPNACLADAIAFYEQIPANYWKRVLIIRWHKTTPSGAGGHALCTFLWNGYVCCYDANSGSVRLTRDLSLREDPEAVAALWCGSRDAFTTARYETREP